MPRSIVAAAIFMLLLIGMFTSAFNIQPVRASGTIYIRADGSVDPDTAPILSIDNVTYTFTDNIYDEIVVERNNTAIDGAGYTLQGTGSGAGIELTWISNVTIRNVEVKAFRYGILVQSASNNSIYENNVENNEYYGIMLEFSSNITIFRNNMTNNGFPGPWVGGITLVDSSNNSIYENNIINNNIGIFLDGATPPYSSNNNFYHNSFINNVQQVDFYEYDACVNVWDDGYPSGGNFWSDYGGVDIKSGPNQDQLGSDGIGDVPYVIDENNQDNYPLMQPYQGQVRNLNTGQSYPTIQEGINNATVNDRILALSGTYYENVVVNKAVSLIGENRENTIIDGNETGNVVRIMASNVNISGFKIVDSGGPTPSSGIKVESNRNTLANNIIENNEIGIYLYGSDANAILNNQIGMNDFHGILTILSLNNNITGNNITLNSNHGIWLDVQSHNNTVSKNILFNNAFSGIILSGTSHNNTAIQNRIASNSQGLQITGNSSGNAFYHNDIIGNTVQALLASYCDNIWDDGYPSGGNYWSDYTGTDLYRGPNQSETGSDGIGDSPKKINVQNQDDYPLTKPYAGPHDIAIMSLNTSKIIVGEGYSLNMTWEMLNYGEQPETFNVTIKADSTTIHTETTMLTGRNSTTMDFTWNTTGVPKGNCTISAYAAQVPDETDTVDNTCIDGWVAVATVGDVNGDSRVDLKDVYAVALAYGSFPGHPKWNPNLDISNDGKIDLRDYFVVVLNYGKVDP